MQIYDIILESAAVPPVESTVQNVDPTTATTANDLMLAQMLQLEFDNENDEYVDSLEKNYNGTSKSK